MVIARLLYLVPDWHRLLGECLRILNPGGVLLHEWANGTPEEPWVRIREQARALFEQAGVTDPFHPGARHESEIEAFLRDRGWAGTRHDLGPSQVQMSARDFCGLLLDGELSYIWDVPEPVVRRSRDPLLAWIDRELGEDADTVRPVPARVRWAAYRSTD